jgi:hypothetical protein
VADLCSDEPASSAWWLLALVEELPDTSAYAAAVQGGREYRGWGWDRHIFAALFDAIQVQTVVIAKVAGAKGLKDPRPIPRPGDKRKSAHDGTPMGVLLRQQITAAKAARAIAAPKHKTPRKEG